MEETKTPAERGEVREKLKRVPTRPGVYLMKNAQGDVIYVGKALSLRNRLRQYFQSDSRHAPKVRAMVAQIADFEYIVTDSELEALILEANLIKRHAPWYNVRLKDDKAYPFVKVSLEEDFPRVFIVRRTQKDGGRYFGPYTDVRALRETLGFVKQVFPIRSCRKPIKPGLKAERPCLNYHIQRCGAPCAGHVSADAYRRMIDQVCLFLEGRHDQIAGDLERRMFAAAERLDFEEAARLRDLCSAVGKVVERQKIVSGRLEDQDVVAIAQSSERDLACAQVFFVRSGKIVGREHFLLEAVQDRDPGETMTAFLQQYYFEAGFIPKSILLSHEPDQAAVIEEWLTGLRGAPVHLVLPQRGRKRELVAMVMGNAQTFLQDEETRLRLAAERDEGAGLQLAEALGLPGPPWRIECYDISNTQGTQAVGSMVVFEGGKAKKSDYRRFKIKTVEGANDFAMLAEVIRRRFTHSQRHRDEEPGRFARQPDLLLIDGGKGQLHSVRDQLRDLGLSDIPTAGIAKQWEHLFVEDRSDPIVLTADSPALYLLQRIRDEAHRFAIGYHRNLRDARTRRSVLDEIPGIGPRRKKALLKAFGSVGSIRKANLEDLAGVPGVGLDLAKVIKEHLTESTPAVRGQADLDHESPRL